MHLLNTPHGPQFDFVLYHLLDHNTDLLNLIALPRRLPCQHGLPYYTQDHYRVALPINAESNKLDNKITEISSEIMRFISYSFQINSFNSFYVNRIG